MCSKVECVPSAVFDMVGLYEYVCHTSCGNSMFSIYQNVVRYCSISCKGHPYLTVVFSSDKIVLDDQEVSDDPLSRRTKKNKGCLIAFDELVTFYLEVFGNARDSDGISGYSCKCAVFNLELSAVLNQEARSICYDFAIKSDVYDGKLSFINEGYEGYSGVLWPFYFGVIFA